MRKNLPILLALATIILATLACGSSDPNAPTAAPRPTSTPKMEIELKVVNQTETSLCYLLVAPSEEEFTKEYLNGDQIAPGESYSVTGFDPGKYNVKVHDCDKHMVNALYDTEMNQELMTWTIIPATLKVVNESNSQFCELYVSPSSAPESAWGPNQLGEEVFEPGMYIDFSLAKGKWDVRAVPCDETAEPVTKIGLKVEDTLSWTLSDE